MEAILERLLDPAYASIWFIVLAAVAAGLVGIALVQLGTSWLAPSRQRVRQFVGSSGNAKSQIPLERQMSRLVVAASPHVTPTGNEADKIRHQLAYIGYDGSNDLATFFLIKLVIGIVAGLGAYLSLDFFPDHTTFHAFMAIGGAGFIGLLIPNIILKNRYEKQKEYYRRTFPEALDILLICVEAGLGLTAAIQRVANEMAISHPQFAEQLAMINEEIRLGVNQIDAMRGFAARTDLKDADSLVNLLAQGMKYGTSVADTLRVFSSELRLKLVQRVEEQAAMIGTKMIFPLILCIFPSFFIVTVGPAMMAITEAFSQ